MTKKDETKIDNIMKCLKCSREEAISVLEHDNAIDHGERTQYDLPKKQEREAMKIANVRSYAKNPNKSKPTYHANEPKKAIMQMIFDTLTANNFKEITMVNAERLLSFSNGTNNFEITLVQKRVPKGGK